MMGVGADLLLECNAVSYFQVPKPKLYKWTTNYKGSIYLQYGDVEIGLNNDPGAAENNSRVLKPQQRS